MDNQYNNKTELRQQHKSAKIMYLCCEIILYSMGVLNDAQIKKRK